MYRSAAGCCWLDAMRAQRLAVVACSMTAALSAAASAQIPCRYQVEAIIQPTGPNNLIVPISISPNGHYVVGYYMYGSGSFGWYYEMPDGPFTALPPPANQGSGVTDVNDAGQISGWVSLNNDVGFIFDVPTQQYTLLLQPAFPGQCSINGINADGVVCGYRNIANGLFSGFVWSPATGLQDLGPIDGVSSRLMSINDSGMVVGWRGQSASNGRGITGPLSSPQVLPPIPGGTSSQCGSINALGTICGWGATPSPFGGSDARAFVYEDGVMTPLGVLPGYRRSRANAIGDNGLLGGECDTLESNGSSAWRAFVWHAGVMRDVETMVNVPPGMVIEVNSIEEISNDGWLAAWGYVWGQGDVALVLSPAALTGDVTGDCAVNISDLLAVLNCWGIPKCEGDADGDGLVNINDLLLVLNSWTP